MKRHYIDADAADRPPASPEHDHDDEGCRSLSPPFPLGDPAPFAGHRSTSSFLCTRDEHHDGRHEAAGADPTLIAVWDDDRTTDEAFS